MDSPLPLAHLLGLIRGICRWRQSARPSRFAQLILERLEDRRVTTVDHGIELPAGFTVDTDAPTALVNEAPCLSYLEQPSSDVSSVEVGHDPEADALIDYFISLHDPAIIDGETQEGEEGAVEEPIEGEGDPTLTMASPQADPSQESTELVSRDTAIDKDGAVGPTTTAFSDTTGEATQSTGAAPDTMNVSVVPAALTPTFGISRPTATETPVEVRYTITVCASSGSTSHEGVATIAAGSTATEVAAPVTASNAEVVTLTVHPHEQYQVNHATATLFPTGHADQCSEAALFAAYRQGKSPEAFRTLVERHHPTVLRTCYRFLGNRADAEDVSQLVFLALARRNVHWQGSLSGWLGTVARNAAIAFLRSRSRRQRHEQQAARSERMVSEESTHDLREELNVALTRLPTPLREAVRLRYLDGLSQNEAAEAAGCPRGTLSQRAAHGVRSLRDILGRGTSVARHG